jgi:hypothetical protein
LIAMAREFLNLAKQKHIPVVVRLSDLQPADFDAIYGILAHAATCNWIERSDHAMNRNVLKRGSWRSRLATATRNPPAR